MRRLWNKIKRIVSAGSGAQTGIDMDKGRLKESVSHGTVQFPLAAYCWNGEGSHFLVKLHWHNETEIVYFQKGSYLVNINMQSYRIQAPAFMFVTAGDIHSIEAFSAGTESAIVFDLKMLSFEYFDEIQYHIVRPLLEGTVQFPQFIFPQACVWKQLKKLYVRMQQDAENNTLDARIRMKACLYSVLALCYENSLFRFADNIGPQDSYKVANTKKILTYLQENYAGKITIDDMAEQLGMNAQYFCRYFKKLTGKTPTGYLNELRIEKAAELLADTERKIIDIAMACGYENMGYFIKRFTQQKGMKPSAYRIFIKTAEITQ